MLRKSKNEVTIFRRDRKRQPLISPTDSRSFVCSCSFVGSFVRETRRRARASGCRVLAKRDGCAGGPLKIREKSGNSAAFAGVPATKRVLISGEKDNRLSSSLARARAASNKILPQLDALHGASHRRRLHLPLLPSRSFRSNKSSVSPQPTLCPVDAFLIFRNPRNRAIHAKAREPSTRFRILQQQDTV